MSDSQQSRMQLRARDDFYGRSSISVSNEFADSTQHVSCFQQIQRWLEVCLRDHPSCRTTLDPDSHEKLPTRLIDALHHSQSQIHRWHNIAVPRLLTSNLEELRKRLDVASFPPTFRDAIEATIRLGFRYIWIDALCIIQDDVQNWKQGAASMAMVYRNAVCNLGAHAAAADPEFVGLFVRRDPEQMQIPFLKIQSLDWEGNYWADPLVEPKRLSSSPLMQRG
ncbi:tol protein [Pyrenophora tritici-repentis Pt-1C-BFP]|uniref:Tol protein n=1 Tax=Pyrenophora tritici-repentis (strain Pt-1C-BFP) TaxID=426418 RepID=B2VUA3_PYRTR|nr:tol protein [Pyrenophora tritici-repentis Pt-1C-BFP]EDU41514.1 tol protein [Pyrenophora tritici-repentis Pt-1C-BFP]